MNWIKDNLPWLFSGLGLAIFAGAGVLLRKLVAAFRPRSKVMRKYIGDYESFHLSTSLNQAVVRSCVTISPDRWGRVQVRVNSFRFKYKGTAEIAENNLYVHLRGDDHTEYILVIFNEPLSPEFDILLGAYSAVTEKRIPVIGKMLWHKIGQPTTCQQVPFEKADPRISTFLSNPKNPIVVSKNHLPLLEEMPSAPPIGAEQAGAGYPPQGVGSPDP